MLSAQLCQLDLGVKTFLWCLPPAKEVFVHSLALCIYKLKIGTPALGTVFHSYLWLSIHTDEFICSGGSVADLFQMAELVPNHKEILIEHVTGPLVMTF